MYFWLGPLGELRELPPIEHDQEPSAAASAPVGEHVSIEGAVSQDRLGRHRRTWELEWPYLSLDEADDIDALRSGHYGLPLWLIDPQRANLAPRQVATAGSELFTRDGWTATAGTVTWVPLRGSGVRPPGVRPIGVITWTLGAGESGTLSVGRDEPAQRAPVCPNGGPVCVGAWVRRVGTDPAAVTFGPDLFDATGGLTAPAASSVEVAEAWLDLAGVVDVPVEAVSFAPSWTATGPCVIQVCGVRYGHGAVPPAPSSGGGAALVFPRGEMPETYPGPDEISVSLTLVEA